MSAGQSPVKVSPRLRVVISCVTFDTVKVVQPIAELRGEKVYIIHYDGGRSINDPEAKPSIYGEFYREVVNQLHDIGLKDEDIVEIYDIRVYEFKPILRKLLKIISEERRNGNDIYINVSAGSTEFVVAATLASMMFEGVKPITVYAKEWTIKREKIRETFSDGGRLYGQVKQIRGLDVLPTFSITPPPRDLVVALRILRERREQKRSTSYPAMVKAIKQADGVWTHRPEGAADGEGKGKAKQEKAPREDKVTQSEVMYYSRHYIDAWIKRGWVTGREANLELTDSGKNVVDIFYTD